MPNYRASLMNAFKNLGVRLGLLPSQKESEFITTIKNSLKCTVTENGAIYIDPSLREFEESMRILKAQLFRNVGPTKSVAEQAIELLRGSRLTESEADSIIDLVKTATCNNT